MKKTFALALICLLSVVQSKAQVTVSHLLTENRTNPVGLVEVSPRFTWQLSGSARGLTQTAYEIRVTDVYSKKNVWSSGKVSSDSSVHVSYKGTPLQSDARYQWQVRVWDQAGKQSAWSETASFATGFLSQNEWKAKWIHPGYREDSVMRPSPLFRKEFAAPKNIQSATAYITAHGLYEAKINGKKVGDAYLTPGWTSYNKRLQYQVYDVTDLLQKGGNTIGVTLGSGWYRGTIGFTNHENVYGKDIELLMQINIRYSDGSSATIVSDNTWKTSTGEIRYSEIYNGETIDASLAKKGWLLTDYNDSDWVPAKEDTFSFSNLVATYNEPVRKHETFTPVQVLTTPKGEKVIDFGQNLVGWVVLKVKGKKGDSLKVFHAEVLDKEGNFYTTNLRSAKATDTYVLAGNGEETFEPHFTWHGFRYIKLEGYPGEIKPENFTAVTLYSDMPVTGSFSSSDSLVNQLQHNIQWGQKGNFLDVPTDCPQRDERLGWTGDAQVFSRTASFNMNVNDFFAKWLQDVEADQMNGRVPFVVPNVLGDAANSAGWADCATIIPWNMYLAYGDTRILAQQYNSMKAYVESIRRVSPNGLWNTGFHFGDWLFYRPDDDNDGSAAVTDKYLIAQCFYTHSAQLLSHTAKVLGYQKDAAEYDNLVQQLKQSFQQEYLTPNGRLVSGTQTAYVLALQFDMLPQNLRQQAADRLAQNVERYNNHLTTGFLGTPYLCHVLTRFGYDSTAYKLLLQKTYPSWLYPVTEGATTIWERWDGMKPDSTFETPSMNSFNHYSYGAIGDWMYRKMAGIDTYDDGVGYKHSRIQPHIGGGFTKASASLDTYYGTLGSSWQVDTTTHTVTLNVQIPANTSATVLIPAIKADEVKENKTAVTKQKNMVVKTAEEGYIPIEVAAGMYHFEFPQSRKGM